MYLYVYLYIFCSSSRGYQADHYVFSLVEGKTYMLTTPMIISSQLGNHSTFHQSHVAYHISAFHRTKSLIESMCLGLFAFPNFFTCGGGNNSELFNATKWHSEHPVAINNLLSGNGSSSSSSSGMLKEEPRSVYISSMPGGAEVNSGNPNYKSGYQYSGHRRPGSYLSKVPARLSTSYGLYKSNPPGIR